MANIVSSAYYGVAKQKIVECHAMEFRYPIGKMFDDWMDCANKRAPDFAKVLLEASATKGVLIRPNESLDVSIYDNDMARLIAIVELPARYEFGGGPVVFNSFNLVPERFEVTSKGVSAFREALHARIDEALSGKNARPAFKAGGARLNSALAQS